MDLQAVLYMSAIVFIWVNILLMVSLMFFLLYIRKKITETRKHIQASAQTFVQNFFKPGEVIAGVGTYLAGKAFKKVKRMFGETDLKTDG